MTNRAQTELDSQLCAAVRGQSGHVINEYLLVANGYAMEAEMNRRDKIRRLLDAGANANARSAGGAHLMWIAGWVECDVSIIRMLVEHGGDPTEALKGSSECLHDDTVEVVRYLCTLVQSDIDARLPDGDTLLHEAASRNNTGIMDALLSAGANVNARNEAGWTPLHAAASEGRIEAVELLLVRGADRNATAVDGSSARKLMEMSDGLDPEDRPRLRRLLDGPEPTPRAAGAP